MVAAILDSPLLTEEDYQLLHFALPEVSTISKRQPSLSDAGRPSLALASAVCLAAIVVALILKASLQVAAVGVGVACGAVAFLLLTRLVSCSVGSSMT